MNVNGGALEFEIVAKTGQLNSALEQSKKMISDFATTAQKGGEGIDAAMQKTAEHIEKAFSDIDTMSGLNQQEIKKLQKAYDELGKKAGDAFMKGTQAGDEEFSKLQQRQQEIKREITIRKQLEGEIAKTADQLLVESQNFDKQREAVQKAANAHTSLRTQLRQVIEQLAAMEEAGERGSEAYRKLQEEAGRLKNAMGDAQQQATILAHDNAGLQGVISAVSGVAGVMSAAQGAVGLFAGENENLQKVMVKVQSLMAITMGLQQAANTLNKDSYFRVVLLSQAQTGLAAVNTRLSASFVKLGLSATAANVATKALMATCTLGLSLAIAGVVKLIERLKKKQDEAKQAQAELRAEQEKAEESLKKIADSYAQQVAEIDALRAALTSENYSQQEKEKIIKRLQAIMPGYTASLDNEGRLIRENAKAVDEYTASLEKSLKFKAAMEDLTELYSKLYQQEKNKPEQKTRQQYVEDAAKSAGISMSDVTPQMTEQWGKMYEAMDGISATFWQQETDKIKADIDKVIGYITDSGLGDFLNGGGSGNGDNTKDPFVEMLNQRKAQYATYTKWISSGDEIVRKAASTQFAGLLQEGATYLDYLKNQRDAIMASVGGDASKLDSTGSQNLTNVNNAIATETANAALAEYKAALQEELKGANNILEVLNIIESRRQALSGDDTQLGKAKASELDETESKAKEQQAQETDQLLQEYADYLSRKAELAKSYETDMALLQARLTQTEDAAEQERVQRAIAARQRQYELESAGSGSPQYDQLLQEYGSFEERKLAITQEYDEKRRIANEQGNAALVQNLNDAEAKAISQLAAKMLESSDAWAQLFGNLDELTASQLTTLVAEIERQFDSLSGVFDPVDLTEIRNKLNEARNVVMANNPFKQMGVAIKTIFKDAGKDSKTSAKQIKKNWKNLGDSTEAAFSFVSDAINSCQPLKEAIGEVGTTAISSLMATDAVAIGVATAIKTAEKSSVILAIIQAALVVVQAVVDVIMAICGNQDKKLQKSIEEHEKQITKLSNAYQQLSWEIDNALGEKYFEKQKEAIKNIRKQNDEIREQIRLENAKKKTDEDKIEEYNAKIAANLRTIEDTIREITEEITQTSAKDMAEELADGIADLFGEGLSSEKIKKTTGKLAQEVMASAVKAALSRQFLQEPLQQAMEQLRQYMGFDKEGVGSFDGLTPEEQQRFKERIQQIANNYAEAMKVYEDLYKDLENAEDEDPSSLAGAIKGASQESIDLLAGQTNAVRVNQVESLTILRESLLHLASIDAKVGVSNSLLRDIYNAVMYSSENGDLRAAGITNF